MIFIGNQRGHGADLARHLMSAENDHVELHAINGFAADTLAGAFQEAEALSRGTQCRQFLYSLSLNPPPKQQVGVSDFEAAIDRAEETLGLTGQPRAIVFHEKEGRRHAHAVWSRIDTDNMKAVNIAFPKNKLMALSRELYQEHGWDMPDGFRDHAQKNPANYDHDEHQQAQRVGKSAAAIKQLFQDAWASSDSRQSFEAALLDAGYRLARGDRRGFVAVDDQGEVYSVARQAGVKTKELKARLGDPSDLPGIADIQEQIKADQQTQQRREEERTRKEAEQEDFERRKTALLTRQRAERQAFDLRQEERRIAEALERQARFRSGLKGLWDRLRGEHRRIAKRNEREAEIAAQQAKQERDALIQQQLEERRRLAVFAMARQRQIEPNSRHNIQHSAKKQRAEPKLSPKP